MNSRAVEIDSEVGRGGIVRQSQVMPGTKSERRKAQRVGRKILCEEGRDQEVASIINRAILTIKAPALSFPK